MGGIIVISIFKPIFTRIGLSKVYYLWIAYLCIKKAAGLKRGARVLDFGCGIGNLVWALRKIGLDAQGIDPSKPAENIAASPHTAGMKTPEGYPMMIGPLISSILTRFSRT